MVPTETCANVATASPVPHMPSAEELRDLFLQRWEKGAPHEMH